tara:strand:+ start:682 stop:1476 length:795 start_codon:yes stop_codon:yes gene_type:complete
LNKHIYQLNNVVVGSSFNAAYYSYVNQFSLVVNTLTSVPFFDKVDLSTLNPAPEQGALSEKVAFLGEAYDHYLSLLSLEGLNMFSDKVSKIRIEQESKTLKVLTKNSRLFKIKYRNLFLFNDENVEGVEFVYEPTGTSRVLDWYRVKSCSPHEHEVITSTDNFVKEIYFTENPYNSQEKELVAVSYIPSDKVEDAAGALEIYTRYKILDMLKSAGIMGIKNGTSKKTGEPLRLSIKLEYKGREVLDTRTLKHQRVGDLVVRPRE